MTTFPARAALTYLIVTIGGLALAEEAAPASATPDPFETLARLAGSMVIVVGLIVGGAYAVKKFYARVRLGGGPRKLMQVKQAINLGGKKQLFALEVGQSVLVIGAAGDSMRLIARIPKAACEQAEQSTFDNLMKKAQADADTAPQEGHA